MTINLSRSEFLVTSYGPSKFFNHHQLDSLTAMWHPRAPLPPDTPHPHIMQRLSQPEVGACLALTGLLI
jgi:hypothetical protein